MEHILRIISAYTQVQKSGGNVEVEFFIEEYPYVFLQIPYNRTLAVFLKVKTLPYIIYTKTDYISFRVDSQFSKHICLEFSGYIHNFDKHSSR